MVFAVVLMIINIVSLCIFVSMLGEEWCLCVCWTLVDIETCQLYDERVIIIDWSVVECTVYDNTTVYEEKWLQMRDFFCFPEEFLSCARWYFPKYLARRLSNFSVSYVIRSLL